MMDLFDYILVRILRFLRKARLRRFLIFGKSKVFLDYFKNFDKLEAVKGVFGEETKNVLNTLQVDLTWFSGYMYVDTVTGHLVVSSSYLNNGDKVDIYLDLIHELYHVKQLMEGKELFDSRYSYVRRPTEIEAYRYTVQEAKRIGLNDKRIYDYLKTEWINEEELKFLAKAVNIKC
jgi:hypothetical protein